MALCIAVNDWLDRLPREVKNELKKLLIPHEKVIVGKKIGQGKYCIPQLRLCLCGYLNLLSGKLSILNSQPVDRFFYLSNRRPSILELCWSET